MKSFALALLLLVSPSLAKAQTLRCNDTRDSSYLVEISIERGVVRVFENQRLVETRLGKFVDCAHIGADRGAVNDNRQCAFLPNGSRQTIGEIQVQETGSTYYSMRLADRIFSGWCQ